MFSAVRKAAQKQFRDRVVITREAPGQTSIDESTGVVTESESEVWRGSALYSDRLSGHPRELGFADLREHHGILRIPVDAAEVYVGDHVTFLSGANQGQEWDVEAVLSQTLEATRRLRLVYQPQEVSRG